MSRSVLLTFALSIFAAGNVWADTSNPMQAEFERVNALADKGSIGAARCVAQMRWYGLGAPRDSDATQLALQKAVAEGDEHSAVDLKMVQILSAGPAGFDPKELKPIEAAAKGGYSDAAVSLGSLHFYGLGKKAPRDMAAAFYWFKMAAQDGNNLGEATLAGMYSHGWGTKLDRAKAGVLLTKAAAFTDSGGCVMGDFAIVHQVLDANVRYPKKVLEGLEQGYASISFLYKDGRAQQVVLQQSSGYPDIDIAAVAAAQASFFPVLPKSFSDGQVPVSVRMYFSVTQADPEFMMGFKGGLRQAVYAAVVLPKHALIYGTSGTGVDEVSFDYLDGKVTNIHLNVSSNDKEVDDATLEAVERAHYPATPKGYQGKKIHLLVPVDLTSELGKTDKNGEPARDALTDYLQTPSAVSRANPVPSSITTNTPSAATVH